MFLHAVEMKTKAAFGSYIFQFSALVPWSELSVPDGGVKLNETSKSWECPLPQVVSSYLIIMGHLCAVTARKAEDFSAQWSVNVRLMVPSCHTGNTIITGWGHTNAPTKS